MALRFAVVVCGIFETIYKFELTCIADVLETIFGINITDWISRFRKRIFAIEILEIAEIELGSGFWGGSDVGNDFRSTRNESR